MIYFIKVLRVKYFLSICTVYTPSLAITLIPLPGELNNIERQLYTSNLVTGSLAPKTHSCPQGPKASLLSRKPTEKPIQHKSLKSQCHDKKGIRTPSAPQHTKHRA